jgi:hypothetical protein
MPEARVHFERGERSAGSHPGPEACVTSEGRYERSSLFGLYVAALGLKRSSRFAVAAGLSAVGLFGDSQG